MHVQSSCFAYKAYCFFDVLVAVHVVGSEVPVPLSLKERCLLFTAVTFQKIYSNDPLKPIKIL